MLFYPLHTFIQGILRRIPQDGTFDQGASVQYAIELSKKTSYAGSLDLSAATDRLPLILQSVLMSKILPGYGQL